jgi:hypothetical protein
VTGALEIIGADRARWQRQAAAELAAILDAYPGLPAIAWTVGAAGCVLAGRVNGLAPAGMSGTCPVPGGRRWCWRDIASTSSAAGRPGCTLRPAAIW